MRSNFLAPRRAYSMPRQFSFIPTELNMILKGLCTNGGLPECNVTLFAPSLQSLRCYVCCVWGIDSILVGSLCLLRKLKHRRAFLKKEKIRSKFTVRSWHTEIHRKLWNILSERKGGEGKKVTLQKATGCTTACVTSGLDYCNLLYAGLPLSLIRKL